MSVVKIISEFKRCYKDLVKNNSYQCLKKEIQKAISPSNIHKLITSSRLLLNQDSISLYKCRLGGSSKYRLIFLVDRRIEGICLLYVYPKFGSKGFDNINKDYIILTLTTYLKEKENLEDLNSIIS